MKFMTALTALLLSASSTILAAPVELAARDVWAPKILEPTETTEWQAGETYNVTWALDNKPVSVTNYSGTVYLANFARLDYEHPLAQGFNLSDGTVSVTIPANTTPGENYTVILVGDSGNASPNFTINGL